MSYILCRTLSSTFNVFGATTKMFGAGVSSKQHLNYALFPKKKAASTCSIKICRLLTDGAVVTPTFVPQTLVTTIGKRPNNTVNKNSTATKTVYFTCTSQTVLNEQNNPRRWSKFLFGGGDIGLFNQHKQFPSIISHRSLNVLSNSNGIKVAGSILSNNTKIYHYLQDTVSPSFRKLCTVCNFFCFL